MELEINEFNIESLVKTSIALFKGKAFTQKLQMTFEIAKGLGTMIGDERKIKQVLLIFWQCSEIHTRQRGEFM